MQNTLPNFSSRRHIRHTGRRDFDASVKVGCSVTEKVQMDTVRAVEGKFSATAEADLEHVDQFVSIGLDLSGGNWQSATVTARGDSAG